jgi:hypothetical protein
METTMNGQQQNKGKRRDAGSVADLLNKPLVSLDMPPGQYPARLAGFGERIYFLPSKFARKGEAPKMDLIFAVRNPATGHVIGLKLMVTPPKDGISSKSGIYKALKPLANGDGALWDGGTDNVKTGVSLASFVGRNCFVTVSRDKEGFTRIDGINVAPFGMEAAYPNDEEMAGALRHDDEDEEPAASGDIPF